MAKQTKNKEVPSGTPAKSKKPRMPGINHIPDFPKGFRNHDNRIMLKLVTNCNKRKKTYITPGLAEKSTEEN